MLEEELKQYIINKYGSVRQFAIKIDVPYTTIDSILKRGINKSNVNNVIKMFKALNLVLDESISQNKLITKLENDKFENNINKKEIQFGNTTITLSKNGKITDKDILSINQYLMEEKIKNNID